MYVMIPCKIRPDGAEMNLGLLQEMYEEMRTVRPKGLRYATFQLEDKVTLSSNGVAAGGARRARGDVGGLRAPVGAGA